MTHTERNRVKSTFALLLKYRNRYWMNRFAESLSPIIDEARYRCVACAFVWGALSVLVDRPKGRDERAGT